MILIYLLMRRLAWVDWAAPWDTVRSQIGTDGNCTAKDSCGFMEMTLDTNRHHTEVVVQGVPIRPLGTVQRSILASSGRRVVRAKRDKEGDKGPTMYDDPLPGLSASDAEALPHGGSGQWERGVMIHGCPLTEEGRSILGLWLKRVAVVGGLRRKHR